MAGMPQIELTCHECGNTYLRWPSQVEGSRFCTKECLQVWRRREVIPNHRAPWLRELNRQPGRNAAIAEISGRKRSRRALERPGGPREGGRTRYKKKRGREVHRVVAERIVGRLLRSDELVHHIDENSFNNDPSNLCIGISRSLHAWIHTQLKKDERVRSVNLNLLRRKKEQSAQGATKAMNYRFKTRPFRHQVKAFKKMVLNRGGALFMEMGTGKTKVAIDWAGAMYMKYGVKKVVVICPKSVKTVWPLELKKHLPDHLHDKIEFTVVNYDILADRTVYRDDEEYFYEGKRHELIAEGYDAIIVDESHLIKKPSAKRTKALMSMGKHTQYKLILTGTPIAKNPLDLFSQFKFLDESIFGTSFKHFKRRYAVYGGYGGYQLMRYINLKELADKVRPKTFEIRKDECLDLPARTHEIVPVHLDKKQRKIYNKLAKDAIVDIDGTEIEADNVLVKMLRLSQITSGLITVKDNITDERRTLTVGKAKQQKAAQLLEDMKSQEVGKIVIFCRFKQSLKLAAIEAKRAGYRPILFHGGVNEADREQRLVDFDETKDNVCFIAQIAAGSVGISLTAANTVIYWEHTYDYGQMGQSYDRVHRIGQHYPVTYYHLIARNTVDEAVWMALKTKKNVADLVLRKPELLMSEGMYLK